MVYVSGISSGFSAILLCAFVSKNVQISSYKLPPRSRLPTSVRRQVTESTDPEVKSDNIDLFAAGPRRPQVKPLQPVVLPSPTPSDLESSTDSNSKVNKRSIEDMTSTPAIRNSKNELRAELMRLEAEKEQLEVDRQRIDDERKNLQEIDLIILQLVDNQLTLDQLVTTRRSMVRKELFFRITELANSAFSSEEKKRFTTLCDDLMAAVLSVDANLHAQLNADIQRELNMELNRLRAGQRVKDSEIAKVNDDAIQQWIERTVNGSASASGSAGAGAGVQRSPASMADDNSTTIADAAGRAMIRFPAAVPINLLPLMIRSPEMSAADLQILKEKVFTPDILNDTIVDFSALLVTFRGKPGVSAAETFEIANERIANIPGMSERLRLFLLPEYRLQGMDIKNEESEKYSGSKYEPVFTILSREAAPKPTGNPETIFFAGTLIATLVTSFMYATDVNSLNPLFLEKALTAATGSVDGAAVSVEALLAGREVVGRLLPIAFGLVGLQAVHDLGHYIAAKNHDTKLSLPYLVPSLQIGLFGTITNFLTFPKTRKAVFDISIAGPALGFLFSLACTVYGFALTAGASPDLLSTFPALPAAFLDSSFLLHEMANQFLRTTGVTDITPALTPVHPLVAVGMTGLLTNAFNFLPIGRLDGGRVAMAVGGRQSADSIAFITLIGQAIMFLTNASPISFFWILVVVFLQRGADIPPIDDVTPVATESDDKKKSIGWIGRALTLAFCAGLTGATILPVPQPYDQQQQQQQIQSPILAPSPSQAPGASNILQGLMGPKPTDI